MRDKRKQERKEKESEKKKGKESGREQEKERKAPNLFIKEKEEKKALVTKQPMLLLLYKVHDLNDSLDANLLPSGFDSLVQGFDEVVSKEVPSLLVK